MNTPAPTTDPSRGVNASTSPGTQDQAKDASSRKFSLLRRVPAPLLAQPLLWAITIAASTGYLALLAITFQIGPRP